MTDLNVPADPLPEALRRRILLVLGTQFVLLMGVAAIAVFWPGETGASAAIWFLLASVIVVPVVMAALSRPLLHDIRWLVAENARLRELYGRARQDSLIDGLTDLGNHRAFQEELARQLDHAVR
jgi:hypothetical protein